MTLVTDRAKLISISLLIMLSMSLFVGIVSEDASAAEAAAGYPHLEAEYTVNPESISSIDDEVVVTLRIKGIGGKVEDLPPDILENMPRKPLDVGLVLDKSGSMESTDYPPDRITAAKEAAKIFVSQIKEDDRVAVVSFSSSTSTVVSFTSDKDSAKSKIGGISTGGGTAVGEGIITALDVLEKGREESVKAIVLLSDGANNRGTSPATAANRAKGRGIPIYTVGIGTVGGGKDPLDEQTLKEIASITGGEYLYAPDEAELKRVYEILSTKVLNVAGTKVSVSVEPTQFFNILKEEPSPLRFENIPPNTEKTVEITGKLTITAPNERIPIINKYTISYLDVIGKDKTIIGGPIYVEYNVETVPSEVKIKNIKFKGVDESYKDVESADGSHKDATVYHLSDDIKAEVEIKNHEEVTVKSTASLCEGVTMKTSTDSKETDKDSIKHTLNNGGVIGSYIFSDYLYYPGDTLTDCEGDTVYVVFDEGKKYKSFSNSDKYHGDLTPAITLKRHRHTSQITLHPRSERILKTALSIAGGSTEKNEAAMNLTYNIKNNLLSYDNEDCDFNDDYTILDTGHGDCTDFSALFISLNRAIDIPARGVRIWYDRDETDTSTGKKSPVHKGHAFAEVTDDDTNVWHHCDPTFMCWSDPDRYLRDERNFRNINSKAEYKPGKERDDKLTTIKYAIGMKYPYQNKLLIDLSKSSTSQKAIFFQNCAKSTDDWWLPDLIDPEDYIAEDFDIEVDIDKKDLNKLEAEITGLDDDDTLDINELDHCTLTIKVLEEYAKTVKEGNSVKIPIKLKVDYETIDGEEVEKSYIVKVRLEKLKKGVSTVDAPKVNYHSDGSPNFDDDSEHMILARAIFGEARSESKQGKIGVGWVIKNRVDNPRWWGSSYHTVILKPSQFSAFNPTDVNYQFVANPLHTNNPSDKNAWCECYEIAGKILNNKVEDATGGADHYYSTDMKSPPYWANEDKFTVQIGKHKFYRLREKG